MSRYYTALAAAFVRGHLPEANPVSDDEAIELGLAAGLRIHKFKRTGLERVQRAIGMLRSLAPGRLLDIGSGRGVFLWPLLDAFPDLDVIATDLDARRCSGLMAAHRGGIGRLRVVRMDAQRMPLAPGSVDAVTMLEVLEHMPDPASAVTGAMRAAQYAVVFSVPSHEDDNPEHIQLFTKPGLDRMFREAGARSVRFEPVLNHFLGVALK